MQNRVALITGSARGIGNEIAKALGKEGYHVLLSDVIPPSEAEKITDLFRKLGISCEYRTCDISDSIQRENLFRWMEREFGRLDVLVNNAGVAPKKRADLLDVTPGDMAWLIDINLSGTFFMCQQAAKMMVGTLGNHDGYIPRIVNIASISSYTASVNRGEYCISKAGISMVTKLFASRLAAYGIPVFEIRPGIIRTEMTQPVTEKYETMIQNGITPVPRMGMPSDVADCVMAAVSGKLDFATGQVLNADGGFHLRRL